MAKIGDMRPGEHWRIVKQDGTYVDVEVVDVTGVPAPKAGAVTGQGTVKVISTGQTVDPMSLMEDCKDAFKL